MRRSGEGQRRPLRSPLRPASVPYESSQQVRFAFARLTFSAPSVPIKHAAAASAAKTVGSAEVEQLLSDGLLVANVCLNRLNVRIVYTEQSLTALRMP